MYFEGSDHLGNGRSSSCPFIPGCNVCKVEESPEPPVYTGMKFLSESDLRALIERRAREILEERDRRRLEIEAERKRAHVERMQPREPPESINMPSDVRINIKRQEMLLDIIPLPVEEMKKVVIDGHFDEDAYRSARAASLSRIERAWCRFPQEQQDPEIACEIFRRFVPGDPSDSFFIEPMIFNTHSLVKIVTKLSKNIAASLRYDISDFPIYARSIDLSRELLKNRCGMLYEVPISNRTRELSIIAIDKNLASYTDVPEEICTAEFRAITTYRSVTKTR